jgi:hypothetical protein
MKKPQIMRCLSIGAAILATALKVHATPYASAITNLSGNGTPGGTIQYRLNEAATNVYVLFYPGAVSNSLGVNGTTGASVGVHTFSLGSATSFAIYCYNIGTGSPHQISPVTGTNIAAGQTPLLDFEGPRGMAVNNNPGSPYFGTIYIANNGIGTDGVRSTGRGLYAINPDYTDAFGYGTNQHPTAAQWGASTTYACYHVSVGPDDMVYASDSETAALGAGVVMADPRLTVATDMFPYNTNLTEGTGNYFNVQSVIPQGSYAAGTLVLYTLEWDRTPFQSIWQYPFYSSPGTPISLPWPTANTPNALPTSGSCPNVYGKSNPNGSSVQAGINSVNTVVGDFSIAPDGKIFTVEDRGSASANTAMYVYDSIANGSCFLWDSLDQNGGSIDPISTVFSVAVSPDDQFVAMGGSSAVATGGGTAANVGAIEYCLLNYTNANGTGGLPNLASLTAFKFNTAANEAMRGIAFDKADNIYSCSGSSSDSAREFTLGFTSQTITSNDYTGTNGSFSVIFPSLTVQATTPVASENYGSPVYGAVTLTRAGPGVSSPLTVNYTVTSTTATNGVDFNATSPGSVFFPAGVATATIYVTNIESTSISRPTASVSVNVLPNNSAYAIEGPTNATIFLPNEGPQELFISSVGASTMYRGLPSDFVSFNVTRWGDTNAGSYTVPGSAVNLAGTATLGVDYNGGPQPVSFTVPGTAGTGSGIVIKPGDITDSFEVGLPLPHSSYTGSQTIIAKMTGGTSVEGTTTFSALANTGTATLLDNLYPPENVIWSDDLSSATDTNNWTVVFSQNTGVYPYIFEFSPYNGVPTQNYDAFFGYPSCDPHYDGLVVPPNGDTTTLRITADKGGGSTAACGINLYPLNCPVLRGNYAVRFSMNLVRGCSAASGTEYVCFGINHYGTNAEWFLENAAAGTGQATFSFTNADGIWCGIAADPGQVGAFGTFAADYVLAAATNSTGVGRYYPSTGFYPLNGASYTSFENVFKGSVDYNEFGYNSAPTSFGYPLVGVPANQSAWYGSVAGNSLDPYSTASCPVSGSLPTNGYWADVEMKQSNNVVTVSINKTVIFTYNNITPFTNGYPMLGYFDPYVGEGTGGGAYFSGMRAVELGPQITNAPVAITVGAGTNATFHVGAIGTGPFTNTWLLGTNVVQTDVVPGPVNDIDSYAIVSAMPANAGSYTVIVSDASGSVVSTAVTLTVGTAPVITVPPANVSTYVGANVTFPVTATGSTLSYIWTSNTVKLANGGNVLGATTATLSLTNVVVADTATYGVTVSNAYGISNAVATLTVLPPPPSYITNFLATTNGVKLQYYSGDPFDTTNSFTVQASTNLSQANEGFTNVTPTPTFTLSGTNFTVTLTTNSIDGAKYYRLLHK